MNIFSLSINELAEGFAHFGIPTSEPGFCDHPAFLKLEQKNPELLNLYAAFVAKNIYSADYISQARRVISRASTALHEELLRHGRLGACVDISGILSRILDKEGIWNACVKGSLTIQFPQKAGLSTRYFWSCDHGNFVAGHAWLLAPPFTVVDISVRQQPYNTPEKQYIPEMVLSEDTQRVNVGVEDIVSPSARLEMTRHGVPPNQHLEAGARYVPEIFSAVPPILIQGEEGTALKYTPVAIHAPDCSLEEMRNMDFNGLTPWELYSQRLRDVIRNGA